MPNTEDKGRQASIEGFANEHIVAGLLMKKYQNVSLVDLPLSPYDMIIVRKLHSGGEDIIRAQVKTARTSVSFTGGTRGGVDREYKSGVKTYTQSPETSDVIIGLKPLTNNAFDMYFIPRYCQVFSANSLKGFILNGSQGFQLSSNPLKF